MVISLNPEDWSRRRLRDGSRLPALASSLLAAESEIAAGRIALFTPHPKARPGLCCSRTPKRAPIWTVDAITRASLAFTRHPCSVQLGLSSDPSGEGQRPCPCPLRSHSFLKVRPRQARCCAGRKRPKHDSLYTNGVRMSPERGSHRPVRKTKTTGIKPAVSLVPKGRFELPRGYPHYALNVARLPIPPLRRAPTCRSGADRGTRTRDLLFTKQLLYRLS